jgi:iron(III) transport system permease protein
MALGLGALAIVPIGLLLLNSFRDVSIANLGFGLSHFTLNNYVEAYSNPKTYTMILNSLWFAIGSMLLAMTFGGGLAFLSERSDLRFRDIIPTMVMVPLIMPSLVKAIAWIFLLSEIGLLNKMTQALGLGSVFNPYSIPAMIWVEGISMSTLAFLLIGATLRRMDPSLEEAALGSGASMWKTQFKITLPLLIPGLAGVMLLLFIRGLEAFEVPLALGMGSGIYVFSANIFYTLRSTFPPDYGLGFAYGVTLMVFTFTALILYQRQLGHAERYTVVMGKGYRPRRIRLGRKGRFLGWSFMGFYGAVAIMLPLFILVYSSLIPFYKHPSPEVLSLLTLKHYQSFLSSPSTLSSSCLMPFPVS